MLAEGTMIVEGDETTTNYFNNSTSSGSIGTWTVNEGQEKSAVLEIRGGNNFMLKSIIPGYRNGKTTTGGKGVSSGLRVTGGYVRVGAGFSSSGETIFVGGNSAIAGFSYDTYPFIEVTGGKLDIGKNLQVGNRPGVNTRFHVGGTGAVELGQYVGCGYSSGPSESSVEIDGDGLLKARYIELFAKAGASTFDVRIADNGVFAWTVTNQCAFLKENTSTPGTMNVLFDGGLVSNTVSAKSPGNRLNVFSYKGNQAVNVSVGDCGARFANTASDQKFSYRVPFVYTNTVPGGVRRPVEFLGRSDSYRCYHYLDDEFRWDGPVRVGRFAYIYANTNATFAEDHDLVLCRDARFINHVSTARTVKNLQIGEADVTGGSATLFVTTNTALTVTGELRVPSTTGLIVYLSAARKWTEGNASFSEPGDYTVLTVPEGSRAALERLKATNGTTSYTSCFLIVDNGNGTLSLKLRILPSASGSGTLSVVGETVQVASLQNQSAYNTVTVGAGGSLVVASASTLSNEWGAVDLRLADGGEIVIQDDLIGGTSKTPYGPDVHFDGGVCSFAHAGNGGAVIYFRYANYFVGAKGAIFDMSARAAGGGVINGTDLHIAGIWAKDPALGDEPDGGITFRGRGLHYLGGTFSSTLEGDFTVADHAQLMVLRDVAENQRIVVKPGCGLRTYESNPADSMTMKDLVLGEAGSATPVYLSAGTNTMGGAFIVNGSLTVHSPVYFSVRKGWSYKSILLPEGTYKVVVFKDGTPDVSKFQADPEITGYEATFTLEDVAEGDYAGYKAVVATVVKKSGASAPLVAQRWTANAAGGNWSGAASWENGEKPGVVAAFAAPQAADVPVTLDEMPYLRQMTVDGTDAAKGYVFGGTNAVYFEAGALCDSTKTLQTTKSNLRFDVPVKAEGPLEVRNDYGSTVAFVGGVEGTDVLMANSLNGRKRGEAGDVTIGAVTALGQLRVQNGRVTIGSLAWVKEAENLQINRGTLRYTGSGETIPGLQIVNGTSHSSVLDVVNDLTVESIPYTASGPFLKIGDGTLRFKGNDAFYCGSNNMINAPTNTTDSVVLPNGDGPINTLANFSIAAGRVVVGTVGDPKDAPEVIVSSQMAVGLHAGEGASPEFVLNNGSVAIGKNVLRIGYHDTLGDRMTTPKVTVNGGRFTVETYLNMPEPYGAEGQNASPALTINGGEMTVKNAVRLGYCKVNPAYPGQASTINVNGGVFTTGSLFLGHYESGTVASIPSYLNLNGGVTVVTNELNLSRNVPGTSILTLNKGAVLKAASITSKNAGGKFVFNGGTLFLTGTGAADTKGQYLVGAGGAVVSTAEAPNGVGVLNVVLKHDPSLGDAPDGGLVKKGPGVLEISPESTFTGPIIVEEGSVVKGGCEVDGSGNVTLADNSVISCFGDPGEWGAGVLKVPGDLIAEGRVYVDFGRTAENPIRVGEVYPIAIVDGTVRGPTGGAIRFRPLNAPRGISLEQVIRDGVLSVEVVTRGLTVILR